MHASRGFGVGGGAGVRAGRIRGSLRLCRGVEAFGFPHSDTLATAGNVTLGNVTALSGLGDDSRSLQISAPVQAGNSGGPLLDGSGNLVGVVSAKLDAVKMAMNSGDLPQNVNFAVKSAILASFLDANRVARTRWARPVRRAGAGRNRGLRHGL